MTLPVADEIHCRKYLSVVASVILSVAYFLYPLSLEEYCDLDWGAFEIFGANTTRICFAAIGLLLVVLNNQMLSFYDIFDALFHLLLVSLWSKFLGTSYLSFSICLWVSFQLFGTGVLDWEGDLLQLIIAISTHSVDAVWMRRLRSWVWTTLNRED